MTHRRKRAGFENQIIKRFRKRELQSKKKETFTSKRGGQSACRGVRREKKKRCVHWGGENRPIGGGEVPSSQIGKESNRGSKGQRDSQLRGRFFRKGKGGPPLTGGIFRGKKTLRSVRFEKEKD